MQSAGRGRLGRSFYSPGDTGLYMSILLRPALQPENAVLITCAAAVAVSNAIREVCGEEVQIKWVNDLFLHQKKVCGILTEASFSAQTNGLDYAVCGIGVNVYPPENGFPEELASIAGAVCSAPEEGLRDRLAAAILRHTENAKNHVMKG
jgi:BirA family biotin operon repressor/biotin-[acetyl-CoA-carboxylase] ligase